MGAFKSPFPLDGGRLGWGVKTLPVQQERASVEFDGALIEYTIVRSARRKKTIEIALDPQQGVIVRSPSRTPRKQIAELVRQRAAWILRKATDDILRPTPRRFTDGETLFYLGSELPIVCETIDADVAIGLGGGNLPLFAAPAEIGVRLEDNRLPHQRSFRHGRRRARRGVPRGNREMVSPGGGAPAARSRRALARQGQPRNAVARANTQPAQTLGQLLV